MRHVLWRTSHEGFVNKVSRDQQRHLFVVHVT